MSNSNKPNWSLARDTITLRLRSQRCSVAVRDSDRNLQKTDLLRAWKDGGERPAATYMARRSIAEKKRTARRFAWRSDHDPKYRTIRYCQYLGKSQVFTYWQKWHSLIAFPPTEIRMGPVAQLTGFAKSSPGDAQNVGERVNVELDHGRNLFACVTTSSRRRLNGLVDATGRAQTSRSVDGR
jgi:hypothetical protein